MFFLLGQALKYFIGLQISAVADPMKNPQIKHDPVCLWLGSFAPRPCC